MSSGVCVCDADTVGRVFEPSLVDPGVYCLVRWCSFSLCGQWLGCALTGLCLVRLAGECVSGPCGKLVPVAVRSVGPVAPLCSISSLGGACSPPKIFGVVACLDVGCFVFLLPVVRGFCLLRVFRSCPVPPLVAGTWGIRCVRHLLGPCVVRRSSCVVLAAVCSLPVVG